MRVCLISAALICVGLTVACGGGGSSRSATPTGNLSLRFGSDSLPGYSQAVVSLEKVEASTDGATWTFLGNVKATYDLMALQNGHSAVILPATMVSAATYSQLRITWATVNYQSAINQPAYAVPNGGSGGVLLSMPVTTVVSGPITVAANSTTSAQIMLSGQQALQVRPGPVYAFQPTGGAFDLATSVKITGHLGDGSTPLNGVEVLAQTVDGLDVATLQRRAITDASGNYVLEGLPAGTGVTYYVAAQPTNGALAYAAKASNPVAVSTATTYTADLAFSGPQAVGALTLTITPPSSATQGTWGELRQTLATGTTGSHHLIVSSQPAATSLVQDQVYFLGLPPGSFGVTSQRSSAGGVPVMKVGSTLSVASGSNVPATLSYP